jgi:hypothetical protein
MIVVCQSCRHSFDDEFRDTGCPHIPFAANDGKNNFRHHPESYLSEKPVPRIDDDETVVEAIREGRHADDIYLLDCRYCGVASYYNQGSHFTCRVCHRTVDVNDEWSQEAITLAEYWETAPYPPDERKP